MTVAFDAFSASAAGTGDRAWTHTPVGTPAAVIVLVAQLGGTDQVTGVTYGSLTLTEQTGSPNLKAAAEALGCYAYFAGSSIPTGAQTVTVSASATFNKIGYAITLTGAANTEIVDIDSTINSDSVSDPSITLSLGGRTSFAALVGTSGQATVALLTPLSSWTSRNEVTDGAASGLCYTFDTIGTTDVTAGWTQVAAEDAVAICIAISEVTGAARVVKMAGKYGGYAGTSGGFAG